MAIFVALSLDSSGEIVHVNLDKVVTISEHPSVTVLKFENTDLGVLSVAERPHQILEMARAAME